MKINPHSKPAKLARLIIENDLSLIQAADRMCISIHTANKYMKYLKSQYGANNRCYLVYTLIQDGIIKDRKKETPDSVSFFIEARVTIKDE